MQYRNGDEVTYGMTVFEAQISAGAPRPDGLEILETRFFSYADTLRLATGAWLPTVLEDVFRKRQQRQ